MHLEQILKNLPLGVGTPYQKTGLKLLWFLSVSPSLLVNFTLKAPGVWLETSTMCAKSGR